MLFHKFFLTLLFLLPLKGICGLLIEPYAGYSTFQTSGSATALGLDVDIEKSTSKGMGYGGRLGYGIANIGMGLDYTHNSVKDGSEKTDVDSMGGFLMANFWFVRVWGEYVFSSKAKSEDPDIEGTLTGKGSKFGLGFSILPMVSLNVEYMMLKYDKEDIDLIDTLDLDAKGIMVSISFPFVL